MTVSKRKPAMLVRHIPPAAPHPLEELMRKMLAALRTSNQLVAALEVRAEMLVCRVEAMEKQCSQGQIEAFLDSTQTMSRRMTELEKKLGVLGRL